MKKIIGIFIMMLMIFTAVLPISGFQIENNNITHKMKYCELEIEIENIYSFDKILYQDTYEIYEGQYLKVTLTGYWSPPNPTKNICLWADTTTMPVGATLTPPCHCELGEVSSIFEWTPSVGQAGTYVVVFYLGEFCGTPLGSFQITIIVHSSGSNDPPLVFIQSPEDGITVNNPDVTLVGYATDDIGIVSIGSHHEWTGDETMTSGTIPSTTYYPFNWDFDLHEGWNRITIFVYDTIGQYGEDSIILYYYQDTQPPVVVIESPQDGDTVHVSDLTLVGYATDDIGIVSIGSHHEWTGDEAMTSGTITSTTYYPFNWNFDLHEGWNRITIFVSDGLHQGSDLIEITYIINNPPNKPICSYDSITNTLSITSTDIDGDNIRYGVDWDSNGTIDQWTNFVSSGTQQTINCAGKTDPVEVITEDQYGAQSMPTSVTSKNKSYNIPYNMLKILIWFFENISIIKLSIW